MSPAIRLAWREGAERLEKRGLSFQVITRKRNAGGAAWEGLVLTFWHACSLEMLWGGIFEAN